mgnify:CR=1 FL=1
MTVSVNRSRVQYTGNGSTTAFNVTFPAITQAEIVVTVTTAGTDSVKTLNTHYTLTAAPFSTGTVTFLTSPSDYTPANNTTITISRNLDFLQSTDYQANDALDATTLETAFDKATLLAQQLDDDKSRMLKFSGTLTDSFDSDDTITTITSSSSDRANKALKFDANGDIGVSTFDPDTYADTADTYRNDALDHRDTAEDYAIRTAGVVRHFDGATGNVSDTSPADQTGVYSSKEWAVGTQSGNTDGSAKQWALGGGSFDSATAVSGSNYSAKEYAVGDSTATGGSAKAWATDSSSPDGTSEKSAKTYASEASASATSASNSASVAQATSIAMAIALG